MTKTGERVRVATVQTVSGGDVDADLSQAEPLIGQAAAEGARLVVLPEYFGIFGAQATDIAGASARADGSDAQQDVPRATREGIAIWWSAARCR